MAAERVPSKEENRDTIDLPCTLNGLHFAGRDGEYVLVYLKGIISLVEGEKNDDGIGIARVPVSRVTILEQPLTAELRAVYKVDVTGKGKNSHQIEVDNYGVKETLYVSKEKFK